MTKTYDAILLLTGEDRSKRFRSDKAIELFNKGNIGHIFITGGYSSFINNRDGLSEGAEIKEYLLNKEIKEEKIFLDDRSLDTIGNFTFPLVDPVDSNPSLKDLSILLVTEFYHLDRSLQCANKVLGYRPDNEASKGLYKPTILTEIYNDALFKAIDKLETPEQIHKFLLEKHPFYKENWFNKPVLQRKVEMAIKGFSWYLK